MPRPKKSASGGIVAVQQFKTTDGAVFDDRAVAEAHEAAFQLGTRAKQFADVLGLTIPEGVTVRDLALKASVAGEYLSVLVDAHKRHAPKLAGTAKRRGRKPGTVATPAAAAPATPAAPARRGRKPKVEGAPPARRGRPPRAETAAPATPAAPARRGRKPKVEGAPPARRGRKPKAAAPEAGAPQPGGSLPPPPPPPAAPAPPPPPPPVS